jgi:hypothetical protein
MIQSVTQGVVWDVVESIRRHPHVKSVMLVGSRAEKTATSLSDWDFVIDSEEPKRIFEDLPAIVGSFAPLGALWDPLADDHRNYIAVFPSLVTLDLHLDLPPPAHVPWTVSGETLAAVDTHFWNWALWLKGKTVHGRDELVAVELLKMHRFLLHPLGCESPPTTLRESVSCYLDARKNAETKTGVALAGSRLEREAIRVLDAPDERAH